MLIYLLKRKSKNVVKEAFLGAFFLTSSIKNAKKRMELNEELKRYNFQNQKKK